MISSGGTAVLGVVFWGIAAHLATTTVVGRTSAEIAAMMLLANIAQLSFGTLFERFLPIAGTQTRRFVTRAYVLCEVVALIVSVAYVVSGLSNGFLPSGVQWRILFVVVVLFWTIFVLQDSALVGLRASRWVPVENISFAIIKLLLLAAMISVSVSQGIFLAWSMPVIAMVIVVNVYLFKWRIPSHESKSTPNEQLPSLREISQLALAQYSTFLLSMFTPTIVALIVLERLGAIANAHYYLPALIASGLSMFLWNIATSFIVEASSEPASLHRHAITTMWTGVTVLTPCILVGVVFAPELLRVFGATYAVHGTTLLRMLLLSLPGSAVTIFYTSFAWLDKRVWWLAVRQLIITLVYFALVLTLIGHFGLIAVGIASLITSGLQGIIFFPVLLRRIQKIDA
jgi:O-antigen/teichoic acid export membrane protein